jgi:aquaporin Z
VLKKNSLYTLVNLHYLKDLIAFRMTHEKTHLMFDFEASEGLQEDVQKFKDITKSSIANTAKKCAVESMGTFYLCSTVALAVPLAGNMAPLAIGLSLMIMIYAFGHLSGAHFNPAVTLAVLLRGGMDYLTAICYVLAQLVGGFLAAILQRIIIENIFDDDTTSGYPAIPDNVPPGIALIVEIVYTFALAIVVLNVASLKSQAGKPNHFYGLAIGMTVTVGAYAAGGISGGAFNPAVGTALPAIHGVGDDIWVYWLGPCIGAAAAAGFFRLTVDAKELEKKSN